MMKKRAFKRNLALGVLIACSLTGPVYADSVNVASGEEKNDASIITVKNGESFTNAGTVNASDSITIDKGTFVNSGTINTGTLDILGLTMAKSHSRAATESMQQNKSFIGEHKVALLISL